MKIPSYREIQGREQDLGWLTIPRRIKIMQKVATEGANDPAVIELADHISRLPRHEQLPTLFSTVYEKILYRPDPPKTQQIRYPGNTLREGVGNCVDYVILISSLLLHLGVPHRYRQVKYYDEKKDKYLYHIYIVTDRGVKLDPVITQKQDGTESRIDRELGLYNYELPYITKKDYRMNTKLLGQTSGHQQVREGYQYAWGGRVKPVFILPDNPTRRNFRAAASHAINGGQVYDREGRKIMNGCNLGQTEGGNGEADAGGEGGESAKAKAIIKTIKMIWENRNIFVDDCKIKCDAKHTFSAHKRRACKCMCAANGSPYDLPECAPTMIGYITNWEGNTEIRLSSPMALSANSEVTIIGAGSYDGVHSLKSVHQGDWGPYAKWIFLHASPPSSTKYYSAAFVIPGRREDILKAYNEGKLPEFAAAMGKEETGGGGAPPPARNGQPKKDKKKQGALLPLAAIAALVLGS